MPVVEHLIADTFGTHIGKYSERLKVTQDKQTLAEAPLLHLKSVMVANRGVSISADALEACAERGIPVFFVDSRGNNYASMYASGLTGTVLTRREQLLAYYDHRGLDIARAIAEGKIRNQAATLKYLAKTRKETDPTMYEELHLRAGEVLDCISWLDQLRAERLDETVREQIMSAEAHAAKRYWAAAALLLPEVYHWPGRIGRGATDPLNSLLNYGYGILYGQVEQVILLAGLDAYGGFLHTDRSGKPSLVLDLIEEFRQVAVDRLVFGLANRGFKVEQDENGLLSTETRRSLAEKTLEHVDAGVRYEGKRYPLRFVMQMQARHLATFLRGDREAYETFKASW